MTDKQPIDDLIERSKKPTSETAYIYGLILRADEARIKAQKKFPQPNYVTLKVAEEAGEVIRAAVHYAEGRLAWEELEGEAIRAIAMILRLLIEGDERNGVIPPALKAQEKQDE